MFDGFKIMRKDQARRLKYREAQRLKQQAAKNSGMTMTELRVLRPVDGQVKSFVSKLVK